MGIRDTERIYLNGNPIFGEVYTKFGVNDIEVQALLIPNDQIEYKCSKIQTNRWYKIEFGTKEKRISLGHGLVKSIKYDTTDSYFPCTIKIEKFG